jgi:hypothetical protein
MADVVKDIEKAFRDELNAADLATLKRAFDRFLKGTEEERAAGDAIAANAKEALEAYLRGDLSKNSLTFVLRNARDGYLALIDAKVIRLRKSILRVFYNVLTKWLLTRI